MRTRRGGQQPASSWRYTGYDRCDADRVSPRAHLLVEMPSWALIRHTAAIFVMAYCGAEANLPVGVTPPVFLSCATRAGGGNPTGFLSLMSLRRVFIRTVQNKATLIYGRHDFETR